ncbi:MAG: propanoyl-CoA acyltransferase [Verrucomicrobia bacterium]|nr:propanoyl-CoA acyltransferase [Verrucomicrobiota bacterium]MBU1734605.1 propanoyl-CoA acyltransferase [Verrucomicrobiota bacterium]MBU1857824.1 propanoyl-CoA acyltransferase [Verrucomicrobiota bacterium]
MSKVSLIGAYNTKFGAFVKKNKETGETTDLASIYDLIVEAGRGAILDAGLLPKDIDAVWVGACSPALFVNQEHLAPAAVEIDPEHFRFIPITRTEAACASSSVALYNAVYGIESGRFKRVLVIGVEKMSLLNTAGVTHALACCSHWPTEGARGMSFPDLFAAYAKAYQTCYGISDDVLRRMLATVAALAYKNGVRNPLAHFGAGGPSDRYKLFTADAILQLPAEKNPVVSAPLHLHDCSLISDGAAAVVLAPTELAQAEKRKTVEIAGIGHAEDRLPIGAHANLHELTAAKHAVNKAFREAGITAHDVQVAEIHDCFTISQVLCVEALGLSSDGRAGYDYLAGRFTSEDVCAVNLSGGLKAKGHPVGATGVSMHALIYKQLAGDPIGLAYGKGQPEIGVTLNIGGAGVTNCVTVLRRL